MKNIQNSSQIVIGKINMFIFMVEKINSRRTFAFTSSNYVIDYNIRLLQSSNSQSILNIDFNTPNKIHFLNFGKYIIVFLYNSTIDREMYFIDYNLTPHAINLMDEIFSNKELEVILALRQKMFETYEGKENTIASIASIYN